MSALNMQHDGCYIDQTYLYSFSPKYSLLRISPLKSLALLHLWCETQQSSEIGLTKGAPPELNVSQLGRRLPIYAAAQVGTGVPSAAAVQEIFIAWPTLSASGSPTMLVSMVGPSFSVM